MELTRVASAGIAAVGHDGKDLHVEFTSGHRYVYRDVPAELHGAFLTAESKGRFFQSSIRGGGFASERLNPEQGANGAQPVETGE